MKTSRSKDLIFNPDRVFEDGELAIAVRVIKNYLISHPCAVIIKASWLILPIDEGEINENSDHPLAVRFRGIGPMCFSIYRTSAMIEPIGDVRQATEKVVQLLFDWKKRGRRESKEREKRAVNLIEAVSSP